MGYYIVGIVKFYGLECKGLGFIVEYKRNIK